jgi:hypothetical protein
LEASIITTYAVAVALTTIVSTIMVGTLRCAREKQARMGQATVRSRRLRHLLRAPKRA